MFSRSDRKKDIPFLNLYVGAFGALCYSLQKRINLRLSFPGSDFLYMILRNFLPALIYGLSQLEYIDPADVVVSEEQKLWILFRLYAHQAMITTLWTWMIFNLICIAVYFGKDVYRNIALYFVPKLVSDPMQVSQSKNDLNQSINNFNALESLPKAFAYGELRRTGYPHRGRAIIHRKVYWIILALIPLSLIVVSYFKQVHV